jgi:hypothetical protein
MLTIEEIQAIPLFLTLAPIELQRRMRTSARDRALTARTAASASVRRGFRS